MSEIAKKNNTLALLDKYGLKANKKFGQNFLIDLNIVQNIVYCANIDKETTVIEIGPGIGSLTQILAREAGQVIAYEIDEKLLPVLSELKDVEVIHQDFLTVDLEKVKEKVRYDKVVLVSNLPYYITTELLTKIMLSTLKLDKFVGMMQKEVAMKLTDPKYKAPLKLLMDLSGEVKYEFTVSQNVFIPRPNVDSAVISVTFNDTSIDKHKFYKLVQDCFKQKRKTLGNNLKGYPQEFLDTIDLKKRAEQLTLDDYIIMTDRI